MSNKIESHRLRLSLAVILAVAAAFMLQSCKSRQQVSVSDEEKVPALNVEEVQKTSKAFKNLTAKVEISLAGFNFKVDGTLRLVPDSALMISIQPFLGIELARILCTTDSVFVVDKYKRNYITTSYADLSPQGGIDLNMLQGLLFNMPWGCEKGKYTQSRYDDNTYVSVTAGGSQSSFLIDRDGAVVRTSVDNPTQGFILVAEYSDFMPTRQRGFYPMTTNLLYTIGSLSSSISLKLSRIEFDKNANIGISIPSGYTQVDFERMMQDLIPL